MGEKHAKNFVNKEGFFDNRASDGLLERRKFPLRRKKACAGGREIKNHLWTNRRLR